ncbi:ATP-binding cassette domain-containing protein [Micromonospora sp. NPDC004704]
MTDADTTPIDNASDQVMLRMTGITKRFFGVTVLDRVDLDGRHGEIHAVMGENGAGKSTLMKILVGAYQPDGGRILIDGTEVQFGHPRQALEKGVSIVHQELNLLPERTVAENIFLGREPRRRLGVDRRAMETAATELLATLGADDVIGARTPVGRLPVAQQQLVEIAKALSFEPRILVLDEPTAALSPHEVDALFTRIRRLRDNGLTVLYISHRLKEIFELTDRITVLKDGRAGRHGGHRTGRHPPARTAHGGAGTRPLLSAEGDAGTGRGTPVDPARRRRRDPARRRPGTAGR